MKYSHVYIKRKYCAQQVNQKGVFCLLNLYFGLNDPH